MQNNTTTNDTTQNNTTQNNTTRNNIAQLVRLYPFLSGCGSIANSRWLRFIAGENNSDVWAKLENGLSLRCSLKDFNGRAAFYAGDTDRKITRLFQLILRPGDTVLDIGANIGLTVVRAASLVGEQGQVHAFEPNPPTQALLQASLNYNHLDNVALHRVAMGEATGVLQLTVPQGHSGAASLVRQEKGEGQFTQVEVPVKTIDEMLLPLNLKSIRLVKIDVEGFEPQVLRGARRLFTQTPPDALIVELNQYERLDSAPTVQFLRSLGYRILGIEKSYLRLKAVELSAGQEDFNGHDILALRPGEVFDSITAKLSGV